MLKHTTQASHDVSSMQRDFVNVIFDASGLARVLVPDGATVEHVPCPIDRLGHYYVNVWINDEWAGFHCGDRTGEVVRFSRRSDAQRLCDERNTIWAARCSRMEVA